METLAGRYKLLGSLLFKLVTMPEKETALLAIPEICADKIITLYHSSLFAGHQVGIKTYLTIGDEFFIPGLIHHLRSYIKGCHICQLSRNERPPVRQLQLRMNLNYIQLSRISIDLKVMSKSYPGLTFILCIRDEVINYLIILPIYQSKSEEIGDALIDNVILSLSLLMNYVFKKFNMKIKTIAPYNHQSLQAELGIKSLPMILT